MNLPDSTAWSMIVAAGAGDGPSRETFARIYGRVIRVYLAARWHLPTAHEAVEDGAQEVFVQCNLGPAEAALRRAHELDAHDERALGSLVDLLRCEGGTRSCRRAAATPPKKRANRMSHRTPRSPVPILRTGCDPDRPQQLDALLPGRLPRRRRGAGLLAVERPADAGAVANRSAP